MSEQRNTQILKERHGRLLVMRTADHGADRLLAVAEQCFRAHPVPRDCLSCPDETGVWLIHGGRRSDVLGVRLVNGRTYCAKLIHDRRRRARARTVIGLNKGRLSFRNGVEVNARGVNAPEIMGYVEQRPTGLSVVIMAYVEHQMLQDYLARIRSAAPEQISALEREAGSFTGVMHKNGVAHKDFSARNILVSGDGDSIDLMIVDFEDLMFFKGQTPSARRWDNLRSLHRDTPGIPTRERLRFLRHYIDELGLKATPQDLARRLTASWVSGSREGSSDKFSMLYLGRTRLHRSRANLIQSLQTIAAIQRHGVDVHVYMPPWPRSLDVRKRVRELGVTSDVNIRSSYLLHPRFKFTPFVRHHKRLLTAANVIYTRVPELSVALADAGYVNHLEVHDTQQLIDRGLLDRVIKHHQDGTIEWLFPISGAAAQTLIRAGAQPGRVSVAPSGVDLEAYCDVPPFNPEHLAKPRLVYMGRLNNAGGLQVFRHIAEKNICDITLIGDQYDEVADHPAMQVRPFIAPRDVPSWYARTDIVLLPYQPFLDTVNSMSPVKLFEAMAAGRPIIASDLGPLREVIEHEQNGLLVKADNFDAWTEAIEKLQKNPDLAISIAGRARGDAEKYSWDQRALGILRCLGFPAHGGSSR
ncbi:MAG: glycosyltransferase [Verrucomicrobia bacterium]|nr:glycosyltransferase [Verrucomicrobiota bacterium]